MGENLYFASDYFETLYEYACQLIRKGKAYVCNQSEEEMRLGRGTVTEPGSPSPYRGRSIDENLNLFERMRAGEFEEGACTLRVKADMASPNMKMRDLPIYRVLKARHHRSGDAWCIYPLYDFAHCLSDSIEGVTHSICTLEFENNRELYNWILNQLDVPQPQPEQTEFARLNLTYNVMSKRKLLQLVEEGLVDGWDDPGCRQSLAFDAVVSVQRPSERFVIAWVWPRQTAQLISGYWRRQSETTWVSAARGSCVLAGR